MGFIFEKKEPVLAAVYRVDFYLDGAGIHFLRSIQVGKFSFLTKGLHCCRSHVHEGDRPLRVLPVNMDPCFLIFLKSSGNRSAESPFLHVNIRKLCGEGGVTAVIGPVGIQHTDFRHRRIPLFLIPEIGLNHGKVFVAHGKAHGRNEFVKPLVIQLSKPFHHRHRLRILNGKIQRFRRSQGCLPGLHRVHQELQDFLPVPVFKMAMERIHQGAAHPGAVLPSHNSQALLCRVRPLVILPRQEFHCQHQIAKRQLRLCIIHRRFRENSGHCLFVILIGESVHIIAVINGGVGNPIPQHLTQLPGQAFLPLAEAFLLPYIQTSDIRQVQHSFP